MGTITLSCEGQYDDCDLSTLLGMVRQALDTPRGREFTAVRGAVVATVEQTMSDPYTMRIDNRTFGPVTIEDARTGEQFSGWRDPEGLWVSDPCEPGYVAEGTRWKATPA